MMHTCLVLINLAIYGRLPYSTVSGPFYPQSADTFDPPKATEEYRTHPLPLLIQPDVRGERITFVSQGDVWVTSRHEKWVARNLTDSQGGESNPKLSHDGQWIAYNHPVDGSL